MSDEAQDTRARILQAAMEEFADHGFSGARVERIAKAAKANVRMIYYYFASKRVLLEEVLRLIFAERRAQTAASFGGLEDLLVSYFRGYGAEPRRVRLLEWEALETEAPDYAADLTNLDGRRAVIAQRTGAIADLQARGLAPADLDPQMLYLAFVALALYPMSFPQSVFVATGEDGASPEFAQRYEAFLAKLARAIGPA